MGIRKAQISDGEKISELLDQLGYPQTTSFINEKIEFMLRCPDALLFVYEYEGRVAAFISMHFIPQIALEGDFARISYFAVDTQYRSQGIGHEILEFCSKLAWERKCDRIEVHSHKRRTDAHRFYLREGFEESPKHFFKSLIYEVEPE